MKNFLNLHHKYLFSRLTIIILLIFFIIYILGIIYISGISNGYTYLDAFRKELQADYLDEAIQLTKFIAVTLNIFIAININLTSHNNLAKYLVDNQQKKLMFISSKLISQLLVALISIYTICLYLAIYTLCITPYSIDLNLYINFLLKLFLELIFYSMLVSLLMQLLPSVLIGLSALILFWFMESQSFPEPYSTSRIIEIMLKYIPNIFIIDHSYRFYQEWSIYLFSCLIMVLGNLIIYQFKEIK